MMDQATLDRFFRARRIAVLAVPRDGKPPLATPIWYDYDGTVSASRATIRPSA